MFPIALIGTTLMTAAPEVAAPSPAAAYFASPTLAVLQHDGDDHFGGTYLRINGGLVTSEASDGPDEEIDFDEGFLVAVAIGQRMSSGDQPLNFDLELEGLWTDQDADSDGPIEAVRDVSVLGAMLNGTVDFRLADRFSIYGGAGIGAAWLDVGTASDGLNSFDDEDGPFLAWQAKAGIMWRFSTNTAFLVGYRFLNIDDAEIDDSLGSASFDLETQQHVLELGLRFGI